MRKLTGFLLIFSLFLGGCASATEPASSVEKNVTVHISKEMLKSLDTDADAYIGSISESDRKKFAKATANADGSVTLVMNQKENRAWLKEYEATVEQNIREFEQSSDYSIQDISFNSDYTTLKITEEGEDAPMKDLLVVMPMAVCGEMHQLMSGVKEKDIRIHCIVRSASGIQIDDVTYPDDLPKESEDKS